MSSEEFKFVHKCKCGGAITRRSRPGLEYVHRGQVYELPENLALEACNKCGDIWTYLVDAKAIKLWLSTAKPVRTLTKREAEDHFDQFLINRGSEPLHAPYRDKPKPEPYAPHKAAKKKSPKKK